MRMFLGMLWYKIQLRLRRFTAKCGHRTTFRGKLFAYGWKKSYELRVNEENELEYCHACLSKMSIKCGWCGEPLFIGDPVSLFSLSDVNCENAHPEATLYKVGSTAFLIGCFDIDCTSGLPYYASFWVPDKDGRGRVMGNRADLEAELKAIDPSIRVVSSLEEALMLIDDENLLARPMPSDRIH